jgi:ketosteroid isomerase-like protein
MRPLLSLVSLCLLLFSSLSSYGQNKKQSSVSNEKEIVKARLLSLYAFINEQELTDSLTFNRLKDFYSDDFVMLPGKAKPLTNKETILEGWRGLFKENKGNFDVSVDRLDVSENLAYALLHYHETFTNIKTGERGIDAMHSAVTVLKKDAKGIWKVSFVHWN